MVETDTFTVHKEKEDNAPRTRGLVQAPRPNTGRKKQKNLAKIPFCKKDFLNLKKNIYFSILLLVMQKYEGSKKN